MGAPSKLTRKAEADLLEAIRQGNYYEPACQRAGITYRTFRNWMERGENAKSGQYLQFFHAVKEAEAEAERRMVEMWVAQIPENWQAARDFLERRFPDRWSRRERLENTGAGGGPVEVTLSLGDRDDSHS